MVISNKNNDTIYKSLKSLQNYYFPKIRQIYKCGMDLLIKYPFDIIIYASLFYFKNNC